MCLLLQKVIYIVKNILPASSFSLDIIFLPVLFVICFKNLRLLSILINHNSISTTNIVPKLLFVTKKLMKKIRKHFKNSWESNSSYNSNIQDVLLICNKHLTKRKTWSCSSWIYCYSKLKHVLRRTLYRGHVYPVVHNS